MKKTIETLIQLGYKVFNPGGYKLFSSKYVYVQNSQENVMTIKIENDDTIFIVAFQENQEIVLGVIGDYFNDLNNLKMAIDLSFQNLRFIPEDFNQVIPENLCGEKEVFDTEKYIKSLIDTINNDPANNNSINKKEAKEKFDHIMNDEIIHKISMEDNIVKESHKDNIFLSDFIKAMNPTQRQFNYDTFIKNVLKDLLNDKMFLITYNLDIEENTIVFEGFDKFTGELLWTTYLDLFALESDEVALFSSIDIVSSKINPSHIFKRKASVASFLEFYRNI